MHEKYMKIAIEEAFEGMEKSHGGPFGAVIIRENDGEIIAREHNRVLSTKDPTMHAEISAIRKATEKLGRFSLHDCVIYSTCMPCPMCLGAIMWAKIPKLYYGANAVDASKIGFDDHYIYEFIKNDFGITETKNESEPPKLILETLTLQNRQECLKLFEKWQETHNTDGKKSY
ncbi:MAG: nucleoside deaminase [Oscillospiraceae bacterium]|nr:nucleoside deaminase [Oscillospiraceae bacterium]